MDPVPAPLELDPPFGVIESPEGLLLVGPGHLPGATPTRGEVADDARAAFRRGARIATSCGDKSRGPSDRSRGWIVIAPAGVTHFTTRIAVGGMLISWNSSPLEDSSDRHEVTFERVGLVFENSAWFEICSIEMLEREVSAPDGTWPTREAINECETGPRVFTDSAIAYSYAEVSYARHDVFITLADGEPSGVFIPYDDSVYPPRDAIVCVPAPNLARDEVPARGALEEVDLRGRDFADWDLRGVSFDYSDLRGADFSRCDLRDASFDFVRADDSIFTAANLAKSSWSWAYGPRAKFERANFSNAEMTYAELEHTNFRGALLTGATMSGTWLKDANLTGANLTGASLVNEAWLEDANLTGANLTGANLSDAILNGANLTGANLSDANLNGANLAGANLTGATMPDGSIHD